MDELDGEFMVAAILENVERRVTKRGNEYSYFGARDATGMMGGFLTGRAYHRLGHLAWDGTKVDMLCMLNPEGKGPRTLRVLGMAPAWAGIKL